MNEWEAYLHACGQRVAAVDEMNRTAKAVSVAHEALGPIRVDMSAAVNALLSCEARTHRSLALALGVSPATISNWRNGRRACADSAAHVVWRFPQVAHLIKQVTS